MPAVEADFCNDGYAWVADVVADGAALHHLCNQRWHGRCTNAHDHTFYCARHFHNKHFAIPLHHHAGALRVFFEQSDRTSPRDQLDEYAARVVAVYPPLSIATLAHHEPRIRRSLRAACRALPAKPTAPLTARAVLCCAETDVFPRTWLPKQPELMHDHAETTGNVLLASAYLHWLTARGGFHPRDFPALARAVDAVLQRLPPELRTLVTAHLHARRPLSLSFAAPHDQLAACAI